jgi:hypothetical protein
MMPPTQIIFNFGLSNADGELQNITKIDVVMWQGCEEIN